MGGLVAYTDLDSLAGAVAYRHCLQNPIAMDGRATENFHHEAQRAGIYLATASADRLDMFGKLDHQNVRDLRFSGFVTWTGNSSMEVFIKMEGTRPGSSTSDTLMLGRFSMVCRDVHTHKARKVPPLIVETEEEKVLWQIGQEHKENRQRFQMLSLDKRPPNKEESAELHKLMFEIEGKKEYNGEQIVPMNDTKVGNRDTPADMADGISAAHVPPGAQPARQGVWRIPDAHGVRAVLYQRCAVRAPPAAFPGPRPDQL